MILSDQEIMRAQTEHNIISDFNPDQVEPASYDLRLADKILLEKNYSRPIGMNEEVEYFRHQSMTGHLIHKNLF